MARGVREPSRTVFECRESFAVFNEAGVPEVYPAGRQVLDGDPILRSHRPFFVEAAELVAERSPGGGRVPFNAEEEAEADDA